MAARCLGGWKKSKNKGGEEKMWKGEHNTPNFMHRVYHAPYFIGCIVEHFLILMVHYFL